MRVTQLALVMALIGITGAQASFKSGNDLLSDCGQKDSLHLGECLGYVTGVADSIDGPMKYSAQLKKGVIVRPRACLRDGVTAGQVRDVVVNWLEENPQLRDMSANSAVEFALSQAFPC